AGGSLAGADVDREVDLTIRVDRSPVRVVVHTVRSQVLGRGLGDPRRDPVGGGRTVPQPPAAPDLATGNEVREAADVLPSAGALRLRPPEAQVEPVAAVRARLVKDGRVGLRPGDALPDAIPDRLARAGQL